MKPTSLIVRNHTRFPLTDCNYHSVTLKDYRSHCAKPLAPSFRDISCQYFQKEARRDFVGEAILFSILVITAAEVGIYYLSGARRAVISLMVFMMIAKFTLVALYFMHLRFDSKLFRRLFVTGIVLAVLVYLIALTSLHVWQH